MTLMHHQKSLAWSVPSWPGSGSGASQSAISSRPGDGRTLGEPSFFPQRGLEYMYSSICRTNAAPSHLKEIYLNKEKHKLKTAS